MPCSKISAGGLHQGFDLVVWSVVGLQIFGGLIVGMVVKYADNILKNFANALSVIFTVLGAMPLFGQYPSAWFIVGVVLVSLSVFMYGKSAPQVPPIPPPPPLLLRLIHRGGVPGVTLCLHDCKSAVDITPPPQHTHTFSLTCTHSFLSLWQVHCEVFSWSYSLSFCTATPPPAPTQHTHTHTPRYPPTICLAH